MARRVPPLTLLPRLCLLLPLGAASLRWHQSSWSGHLDAELQELRSINASALGLKHDPRPVKGRIAVIICGLKDRLLIASKMKNLIIPLREDGWGVDVYMRLVLHGHHSVWKPMKNATVSPEAEDRNLEADLGRMLADVGARLAHYEPLETSEDVSLDVAMSAKNPDRLWQYPPLNTSFGQNVLRRLHAIEALYGRADARAEATGEKYNFTLVTRDDDHWMGRFTIKNFAGVTNATYCVFSKNCQDYMGVNDKTLLFGHNASKLILRNIASNFWRNDTILDQFNAEVYWRVIIPLNGMVNVPVIWHWLPTADSVYVRTPRLELCQKPYYLCNESKIRVKGFERPNACEPDQEHEF